MCASERKDVFSEIDTNLFLFEKKILLLLMRDTATKRIISLVIWTFLFLLLHTNNQNYLKLAHVQKTTEMRVAQIWIVSATWSLSAFKFLVWRFGLVWSLQAKKSSYLKILKAVCLKWELQTGDAKIPIMGGYIVWNVYPGSSQEMRRKLNF